MEEQERLTYLANLKIGVVGNTMIGKSYMIKALETEKHKFVHEQVTKDFMIFFKFRP